MKIELDLPEIEGFEYTGEYRAAKEGEYILDKSNARLVISFKTSVEFLILKKKAPVYIKMKDYMGEYVEIRALRDALAIIDELEMNGGSADRECYAALEELVGL